MNKWKISAFFLITVSLIWFFIGISFIFYALTTKIDFLFAWIVVWGIPCFIVWFISYRLMKKSSNVKTLNTPQPYNQYSTHTYSPSQKLPDVVDGFRFESISYRKEGQLQWNFIFSDPSVLQDKIYFSENVELVANALEANGASIVDMFYQIDNGNPIKMHLTKIDEEDPIQKNLIPHGWKSSLFITRLSPGEHKIAFKALDSQGRHIEKSFKFIAQDVRIVKLKKQSESIKANLNEGIILGIICLVLAVFLLFLFRVFSFWLFLAGFIFLLYGVPKYAIKSYRVKRQIKKLK